MGKSKEGGVSASWDSNDITIFCDVCIREIELGHRLTTHFSKEGWKNLVASFKERTGKNYDRLQMKNKWDHLKKEWIIWKELKHGETGLGWDQEKKTIAASDEWWEDKLKVIPVVRKFRYEGIAPDMEEKMDRMFRDVVATGEDSWAPSIGGLPPDMEIDHNLEDMKTQECGLGEVGGNTSTTIGNASTSSGKRRKIGKKKGVAISYMSELRESALAMKPQVVTIKDAVDLITSISDIYQDNELYYYALNYIKDKSNREVFMSIPADKRVWWIKNSYASRTQ